MYRIAICDDSIEFCNLLYSKLLDYFGKQSISPVVEVFQSGTELIISQSRYDFVLLDVEMVPLDGIETAKILKEKDLADYIIFISSYIRYAPIGYEVSAFRYILKCQIDTALFPTLTKTLSEINNRRQSISLKAVEGITSISIKDIMYIESQRHKIIYHLNNNSIYSQYRKLDEIAGSFKQHSFLRIHQSFLVNMQYIKSIVRYQASLKGDLILPIAKSKYSDVIQKHAIYWGQI